MKTVSIVLFICIFSFQTKSQVKGEINLNCTLKQCELCCIQTIRKITTAELVYIAGIKTNSAREITNVLSTDSTLSNFKDLKKHLSKKTHKTLKKSLKNLSTEQIEYLSLPIENRKEMINFLNKLPH